MMMGLEFVAHLLYEIPKHYGLVFDVVHYILCLQGERADLGNDFEKVAKSNPLACWFSSMLVCFAGGILVALLCGQPSLYGLVGDPTRLAIATALWYLMFYFPKDLFHTTTKQIPLRLPLNAIKGLYYPNKILAGIKYSRKVFGRNWLAAVIIATAKGNGSGLIKPVARLMRGNWTPDAFESMKPSVATKYCALCAALYALFPYDVMYIAIVGVLIAMRVGPIFDVPVEKPFEKVEEKLGELVFSGAKQEKQQQQQEKQD